MADQERAVGDELNGEGIRRWDREWTLMDANEEMILNKDMWGEE